LSSIVRYDGMRQLVSAYYVFLDELLNLLCCDGGEWFGFDPFCEVIDPYDEEFNLSFTKSEQS